MFVIGVSDHREEEWEKREKGGKGRERERGEEREKGKIYIH